MTWFKVDDHLWGHPKVDAVSEDELERLAAMGLWTLVGSHAADYLTDGVVARATVRRIAPQHGDRLAARLVEAGLWHEHEKGWVFHDWHDHQPSKAEVEDRRDEIRAKRAAAGRIGGQRSAELRRQANEQAIAQANAKQNEATAKQTASPVPSRPVPSRPGERSAPSPRASEPVPTLRESAPRLRLARPPEPIPDDFAATQETVDRCRMVGRPDPRPLVADFVAHHRSRGTLSVSWQDELFKWAGKQQRFDRQSAATGSGGPFPAPAPPLPPYRRTAPDDDED